MPTQRKNKNGLLTILQFVFVIILLIMIFAMLKKIYYSIQKEKKIKQEIETLQKENEKYNRENDNLNKLIKYLRSETFKEKAIKEKLNMVKQGEQVVVIQDADKANLNPTDTEKEKARVEIEFPNYYLWWQYFFGKR